MRRTKDPVMNAKAAARADGIAFLRENREMLVEIARRYDRLHRRKREAQDK